MGAGWGWGWDGSGKYVCDGFICLFIVLHEGVLVSCLSYQVILALPIRGANLATCLCYTGQEWV